MSDERLIIDLSEEKLRREVESLWEDVKNAPPIPNDLDIVSSDVRFFGAVFGYPEREKHRLRITVRAHPGFGPLIGGMYMTRKQWEELKACADSLFKASEEYMQNLAKK